MRLGSTEHRPIQCRGFRRLPALAFPQKHSPCAPTLPFAAHLRQNPPPGMSTGL